jgi:hypothetical protein
MFYVVPADQTTLTSFQVGEYYAYNHLDLAQIAADELKRDMKRNYNIVSVHTVYTTTTLEEAIIEDRVNARSKA